MLSVNDVPELRELFAWAAIEEATTTYQVGGQKTGARELIIRPPGALQSGAI